MSLRWSRLSVRSWWGEEQVTTGDVLRAVGLTRRTLTPELVAEFEQDIQAYGRV